LGISSSYFQFFFFLSVFCSVLNLILHSVLCPWFQNYKF
jgi:hypothetical protein